MLIYLIHKGHKCQPKPTKHACEPRSDRLPRDDNSSPASLHAVAVFFDLEKAYDTTWKYGIMKDLHDSGLRGRLPTFIEGFLKNRQFHVKVGSSFSQLYDQEMGVPQGSILSFTLFGRLPQPVPPVNTTCVSTIPVAH